MVSTGIWIIAGTRANSQEYKNINSSWIKEITDFDADVRDNNVLVGSGSRATTWSPSEDEGVVW